MRNPTCTQATADVSGLAQETCKVGIGASYGDAFLAALAVGEARRDLIKAWNPTDTHIAPNPANLDIYRRRYDVFRELYPRTRELMARLDGRLSAGEKAT